MSTLFGGPSGVVIGLLLFVLVAGMIGNAVTTSVTAHEQGVVIRQNLRRRFIPWQPVTEIRRSPFPIYNVLLKVGTDVKCADKLVNLTGTKGSRDRVLAIVAEMQEFQRGEREARRRQP